MYLSFIGKLSEVVLIDQTESYRYNIETACWQRWLQNWIPAWEIIAFGPTVAVIGGKITAMRNNPCHKFLRWNWSCSWSHFSRMIIYPTPKMLISWRKMKVKMVSHFNFNSLILFMIGLLLYLTYILTLLSYAYVIKCLNV